MPTRQICTKAVGVQITASVTQKYDALRLYLVREICSVIEMVPITLSQCLFRLLYRKGRRTHTVSMTVAWYTFRVDCCEFYCPQISWNLSLQRLVGSQKRSKSQPENQSQQCQLPCRNVCFDTSTEKDFKLTQFLGFFGYKFGVTGYCL